MHIRAHPPGYLKQTSYFFPPFTALANRRPDLLEMADLSLRRYGNVSQRQAVVLPRVAKCIALMALEAESPETGADLATVAEEPTPVEEHVLDTVLDDEVERTSSWPSKKKTSEFSESSDKWKRNPHKSVKALLKRLRIRPGAQRILGNSRIAVVSLERLNIKSVLLSSAQPVVCLARLPRQKQTEFHRVAPLNLPQQNGFNQGEANVWGIRERSLQSKPQEPSDLSEAETTVASWTEPYCPDSSSSEEPEQDSGFDCESNPDHQIILCDSGSDDGKTHSETFYLDPDAGQTLVVELDPQAGQGRCLQLGGGSGAKQEADVVQMGDSEDQRADPCCLGNQAGSPVPQWDDRAEREEMESDDFCAVCSNGGDLLCCDRCPKVYHVDCHIPSLTGFPVGDWMCTLCRTDQEPVEAYHCEDLHSCVGVKAPYTLSNQDQRRCERLTLQLYCHPLSAPFHEPVSSLARNYYQIIKRPIDLSVIRRKLDKSNTLHYFTAEQFVDDVFLMFKNCATFNYPDSEVAQAGRSLEVFFLGKLKEVFPDRTFPSASQVRTDKARRRWLSRKRKENYRKKKCAFPGKKYYL